MELRKSSLWFFSGLIVLLAQAAPAVDLIPLGSTWKYRLGTQEASSPISAWRQIGFNDAAWNSGGAPIGYDTGGSPGTDPIVTTTPTSSGGNFLSIYFRKTFTVSNPASITDLILSITVDDGAVAWLNGNEVGRINMPAGDLAYNANAESAQEARTLVTANIAKFLVAGNNVIALHAFNANSTSTDLVMDAVLAATVDEPPTVLAIDPFPSSVVMALSTINVTFSENVSGVNAADLRINGTPATTLTTVSPREYVFGFTQPPTGSVSVAWAPAPGIMDLDDGADAFVPGAGWTYTLNPNAIPAAAIISEFMADNENGIRDEDGTRSDWVEIYNPGPGNLNLSGWYLTDTPANLTRWRFPSINLGVNKYLLVWASQKNRSNPAAPLHTNFKIGKDAGGYLALVSPATNVVSVFTSYPAQTADVSFGRDRLDPDLLGYFVTPTPGAQNSATGAGLTPEPVFSLESGIYTNSSLSLTITAPPGVTLRYRLDGLEPTNNSPVYSVPITFSTNMVIKVRAYSTNTALWPSRVVARNFILLDSTTREFNSNLPVLVISTQGKSIPQNIPPGGTRPRGIFASVDTFRGRSSLKGAVDFIGLGQFEIVGQTSAGFAKPPYRIELNDELGNDRAASVLGLPAEADWNLRNPYSDKCLMNDFLGYELWEDMGHYSCRRRFVELFVDTDGGKLSYPANYVGVLVLFERIEIDKNRVDLAKLTPAVTNEPAITGGYIIKKDKDSEGDIGFGSSGGAGHSGQYLKFHDPKPREITTAQQNWIANYVNRFEASMYAANWTNATGTNHYSHYIDVDAFADQHLHVEFTKQIDGYRLSSYYSKDRNGKLKPEPVWDWNLSFGNADYYEGGKTNGWYWNQLSNAEHIWLRRLVYGRADIDWANPANGPGDPDFRQRITDRWAVLRTNVLNGDRLVARIDQLATLLAEAAERNYSKYPGILNTYLWPNPQGPPSWDVDYTQPTYAAIISEMKKWTKGRYVWMDSQFPRSPAFNLPGGSISSGASLVITAPAGSIYYTLDGSDPRLPGGGIAPGATRYTKAVALTANARVVARAYANPTSLWTPWSGPMAATYVVQAPKLVITEIMYHPAPPPVGSANTDEDFEFLELKNLGNTTLNLNGFTLSGGVEFTFPNLNLAAGQRVVVVNNQAAFTARYGTGMTIAGEYTGNLANDGDRLILRGRLLEPILDFSYEDGWHPMTDGFGFSLVVVDENAPATAWGTKAQWRPSGTLGGTPGQGDAAPADIPQVVINEALTHSDPAPPYDTIELLNLSATPANVGGWFLTDDFGTPKKFRLPDGTTIPAGGYLTFDETAFNVASGGNIAFSLSSMGDEVYLFSADAAGNLTGYYHGYNFEAARTGVTFGRYVASTQAEHFVPQATSSLGRANTGPLVGPAVISEIMYHPPDVLTNGSYWDNVEAEYIELRGLVATNLPLYDPNAPTNTWRLRNAVDFDFPTNVVLPPGGRLLVVGFDPQKQPALRSAFLAKYGLPGDVKIYGPWNGKLDNSGETIELKRPDHPEISPPAVLVPYCLVEQITYSDAGSWPTNADGGGASLQRVQLAGFGDDVINWRAVTPFTSQLSAPTIVQQPAALTVAPGASAVFTVAASGSAPLSYQWYMNGAKPLAGATGPTLVLTDVQPVNAGSYHVVVTNSAGAATSTAATLTVLALPTIDTPPANQTTVARSSATFSVAASGSAPLSYQWYFNGTTRLAGATNATLVLNNVQPADEGRYHVVVTNSVGSVTSAVAALTVLVPPTITASPANQSVIAGASATFTVAATGTAPLSYQWYFNSTTRLAGATNSTLVLNNVQAANAGAYHVVVSNRVDMAASAAAVLTVLVPPAITAEPVSQSVASGSNVTFSIVAGGTAPLSYQWYFNGTTRLTGATSPTLVLNNVQAVNVGAYHVVVTNNAGVATSAAANLTLLLPPTITTSPTNQVVLAGSKANFTVTASGSVPLGYQWFFNGSNALAGATQPALTLTNVQPADTGAYHVVVTNSAGVATSAAATLVVLVPPTITTPPLSQTIAVGSNATFGVVATGSQPLAFQWVFNVTNILHGATNAVLTLANAQLETAGNYQVMITNTAGAVTSAMASLTVTNTNPILDSDGDGMADSWELANGTNPQVPDANVDPDQDGLMNWQECIAGTSPTNAASVLRFAPMSNPVTGAVVLQFTAVSNQTYTLLYKDSVNATQWNRLTDVLPRSTNWTATATDPAPGAFRYYRIITPKQEKAPL